MNYTEVIVQNYSMKIRQKLTFNGCNSNPLPGLFSAHFESSSIAEIQTSLFTRDQILACEV